MPTRFGSHTVESEHTDSKGVREKLLEEMTVFKPGRGAGREGRERPRGSTASEEELGWWASNQVPALRSRLQGNRGKLRRSPQDKGVGCWVFRPVLAHCVPLSKLLSLSENFLM